MSTKIYIDWQDDDFTWDEEIRLWEEVYIIVGELISGGARDPQYWGDLPDSINTNAELRRQIEENLERLKQRDKKKLIKVLVTLDSKKYEETKELSKNIKITVDDVLYLAENMGVDVKIMDVN